MPLVSMKMEDGDSCCPESNPYGYGLEINLTEDQVEALGLKVNAPEAGSKVNLMAVAVVRTVTKEASPDGDSDGVDVCLRLQITDLEVIQGRPSVASKLYPDMNP